MASMPPALEPSGGTAPVPVVSTFLEPEHAQTTSRLFIEFVNPILAQDYDEFRLSPLVRATMRKYAVGVSVGLELM